VAGVIDGAARIHAVLVLPGVVGLLVGPDGHAGVGVVEVRRLELRDVSKEAGGVLVGVREAAGGGELLQ